MSAAMVTPHTIAAAAWPLLPRDGQSVGVQHLYRQLRAKGVVPPGRRARTATKRFIVASCEEGTDEDTGGTVGLPWHAVDYDRKRTAYHEAGHAAVAHLLGYRVMSVSARRGLVPSWRGCCSYEQQGMTGQHRATIALAGMAAKALAGYTTNWMQGGGADWGTARAAIGDQHGALAVAFGIAAGILSDHWAVIDALAYHLCCDKQLDGAMVAFVIDMHADRTAAPHAPPAVMACAQSLRTALLQRLHDLCQCQAEQRSLAEGMR